MRLEAIKELLLHIDTTVKKSTIGWSGAAIIANTVAVTFFKGLPAGLITGLAQTAGWFFLSTSKKEKKEAYKPITLLSPQITTLCKKSATFFHQLPNEHKVTIYALSGVSIIFISPDIFKGCFQLGSSFMSTLWKTQNHWLVATLGSLSTCYGLSKIKNNENNLIGSMLLSTGFASCITSDSKLALSSCIVSLADHLAAPATTLTKRVSNWFFSPFYRVKPSTEGRIVPPFGSASAPLPRHRIGKK